MSAMPERVWLTPDVFNRLLGFYRSGRGGEYDAAADTLNAHDTALRTALLAAEARVRELEQIHRDEMDLHDEMEAKLAAERDALVPLARLLLQYHDDSPTKGSFARLEGADESFFAPARAILDREGV